MTASTLDQVRFVCRLAVALAQRPRLVPTALRQFGRLVPTRWWAQRPFLPVPRADYVEFRQVTATGSADQVPDVDDVITWLDWCRSVRSLPDPS